MMDFANFFSLFLLCRWLQNVMVTLRDPAPHTTPQNAHIISHLAKLDLAAEVKWLKWVSKLIIFMFISYSLFIDWFPVPICRKFLTRVNSPVVFCHNDMQEGNILLVKDCSPPRLVLIDFEYCSYNYRAFDLANHFLEWTYDYTLEEFPHYKAGRSDYPSPEQQVRIKNSTTIHTLIELSIKPTRKSSRC